MAIIKDEIDKTNNNKELKDIPNAETIKSKENIKKNIELHRCKNIEQLYKELFEQIIFPPT